MALAIMLFSALAAAPAGQARTYKVLYNFTGGSDGAYPYYGSLVQDKSGNLYGTTYQGGSYGCGTVFKLTKSGTESVLHTFTCGSDGAYPLGGLALSGSTLYGTAANGGDYGYGVVFELNTKTGAQTVLYSFRSAPDGNYPWAVLVRDKKGNLYGTTYYGGSSDYGAVFEVVPKTKKETVLHSFDYSDGKNPFSGLTLNPTGKILYGTAEEGGSSGSGCGGYGCGVVFSLTIKSATYTVLYNFTGSSDGGEPWGTLALDPNGNLYGTTAAYGAQGNGTVFEVVPKTKKETVLYSFTGGVDGGTPWGGVMRDKKGNLYGTTILGGANSYGTAFELAKGTESVLHSFDDSDGEYPHAGLLQDSKGDLYGTAATGGSYGYGVVWEITP
jgi:uncharacterized repeat protein (TIGR03803 family)